MIAKIVEVLVSVLTGGVTVFAKNVEVPASASMGGSGIDARNVQAPASVTHATVPVGVIVAIAITATPNSRRPPQGAATNAGTNSPPSVRLRTAETASALDAKYC